MKKFLSNTALTVALSMLLETGVSATTTTITSDDTFESIAPIVQETNIQKQFSIEIDDTTGDFCVKAEDEDSESVYNKDALVAATETRKSDNTLSKEENSDTNKNNVNSVPNRNNLTYNPNNYTFNANLLTRFNTITAPQIGNGANEPKLSYNSFIEENVSPYSGELTLNFEDLTLEGRNGLDLRIGRTYQSVASSIGEKSLMILPNENGYLRNCLINNYSTYLIDRYNLGMGWGFSFPSVQIETEYIPEEIVSTYYYEEEKELYYHTGNGEVYQVQFTSDTSDSNLKGYYKKDIQFNKNDTAYTNGQVVSYYSMTLADKTKQYFAEDGRLIGIVDRFGNTIKFEHTMTSITNRVPEGSFRYDDDMWISSTASNGTYDAYPVNDCGNNDDYSMYFRRDNEDGDTYIISQPIQVKPLVTYNMGVSVYSPSASDIKVEIIGYDTAYNYRHTITKWITNYTPNEWYNYESDFSMSSAVRYIVIKITPDYARGTYIDNVCLDEPKPLISRITDSIGRTVDFTYTGDIFSGDDNGSVSLLITTPDNTQKTLTYNKETIEFTTEYIGHQEQRKFWYLINSNTEGDNGNIVKYYYGSGVENGDYVPLYLMYNTKTHSNTDGWINKPVLTGVRYKNRQRKYEYETVRKNLGDDGYYDTLRISKRYEQYNYIPTDSPTTKYKGEINKIEYDYSGTYNGVTYDNETGYPNFEFDDTTTLNEEWTSTQTAQSIKSATFSNGVLVRDSISDNESGVLQTNYYTNDLIFKDQPIEIRSTIIKNGQTKERYKEYSYNSVGYIASESKEVDATIKNDIALLEKYTTLYEYEPTYNLITQKQFYRDLNGELLSENYTYDNIGRLTQESNINEFKTNYTYDTTYPGNVIKTSQSDAANIHYVLPSEKEITYVYDQYGLYKVSETETANNVTGTTGYQYEYIYGNPTVITYPDNSTEEFLYYSDGRIYRYFTPITYNVNNEQFYVMEQYSYNPLSYYDGYDEDTSVMENVTKQSYKIVVGTSSAGLFATEHNFYDTAGNLRVKLGVDYSRTYELNGNTYNPHIKTFYRYDNYDRLISETDDENKTVEYNYDNLNRIVSVKDYENNFYRYSYDDIGQKTEYCLETSDNEQINQIKEYYDDFGNTVMIKAYPDGINGDALTESYEYNLDGNCTKYTSAENIDTLYEYDKIGRLSKVIYPDGTYTTAAYSNLDNPTFVKLFDEDGKNLYNRGVYYDEKGNTHWKFYLWDNKLNNINSYDYDAKGRLISSNEFGYSNDYVYDQTDNVIVRSNGDAQIHRRYSQNGEKSSASNDSSISEIYYGYDGYRRLSSKRQDTFLQSFSYSTIGNITGITQPTGRIENYTYTPNGKTDTITTDNNTVDYDYYANGYVKKVTYPNGMTTEYEYDNLNRINSVITKKNGVVQNNLSATYTYDGHSNILSEIKNSETCEYEYDELDRLTSISCNGNTINYTYDALGNRLSETHSNGTVKEYEYNDKYQLVTVKTDNVISDTYEYDGKGNLTRHNNTEYTYDVWNKLQSVTENEITHTYKYDANGIRTAKDNNQYIVDVNNNVIAETDSTGNIVSEVLWGNGKPIGRKVNNEWYYYIYNAHGDVIALTDSSGTIKNSYSYDVWGNIKSESELVDNPIKYAGEYYDNELDMYYLRARYYDPQIGRFTSFDIQEGTVDASQNLNRYVYCKNNPVKYVDPSGEAGIDVASTLLWDAFFGGGANKDYGNYLNFYTTFYSSPILNKEIKKNFEVFKSSGQSSSTVSGSIGFYGNDLNPNDLDLHLGVGKANYTMKFKKEIVTKRFLRKTWTETQYSVTVTISDTYDFDQYREGTSISNWLNNWGYDMQKEGKLTPFFWSFQFKKGL